MPTEEEEARQREEDMAFYADDDMLDGLDAVGYVPTMEMQQMLMGSFANLEEKQDKMEVVRPKVDVFGHKSWDGQTHFVVRLTRPSKERLWFLKKYGDFLELSRELVKARFNKSWGEDGGIEHVPELPEDDKVGITRRLSLLGLNDFIPKQRTALQAYLDALLVQIPDLDAVPHLSWFFSRRVILEAQRTVIEQAILEQHKVTTLQTMQGYWKLNNSQHMWLIEGSGRALLNGKHRGVEYDLTEEGVGVDRVITRPDGWSVDLAKSSYDKLIWYKPGHKDLEWEREGKDKAEALIRKYAAKRAALLKQEQERQKTLAAKMSTIGEDESQTGSPKNVSFRKATDDAAGATGMTGTTSKGSSKGKGYVAPPAMPPNSQATEDAAGTSFASKGSGKSKGYVAPPAVPPQAPAAGDAVAA